MAAIYRAAARVTVWLRHPFLFPQNAPDSAQEKRAAVDAAYASQAIYQLTLLHALQLGRNTHLVAGMTDSGVAAPYLLAPLARLMHNPWFERVWVVQEAVLARHVRVLYANVSMDWDMLVTGLGKTAGSQELSHLPLLRCRARRRRVREVGTTGVPLPLLDCRGGIVLLP